MLIEVETFREVTAQLGKGLKAWPRRLRRLRCSLDSARNDGYENTELSFI
jgi:hypothetical protein